MDLDRVLAAIEAETAMVGQQVWGLRGERSSIRAATQLLGVIIDLDATLVTAHSDKEHAKPTYKRGYGFHPLLAFLDHGAARTGEPMIGMLRPGNARIEHRRRPHRSEPAGVGPVSDRAAAGLHGC